MFTFLANFFLIVLANYFCEAIISPTGSSLCDIPVCKCPGNLGKVICDCSTYTGLQQIVTLKPLGHDESRFSSISITNCSKVHVSSKAIEELEALRQITLAHIGNLTLEELSFSWHHNYDHSQHHGSGITINITNASIPNIPSYTFKGSLQTIILKDVHITSIQAFGFSSLSHTEKIEFINTDIFSLEPQAFKKFSVHSLIVTGGKFMLFPSHSMVDLEVNHELKFENVDIDVIRSSAIRIHGPRYFRLMSSRIGRLEENSFRVHTQGPVFIHDNVFISLGTGAFLGITVERTYLNENGCQEFIFVNNTISNFENASLFFNASSFDLQLDWIILDRACSCTHVESWLSKLLYYTSDEKGQSHSTFRIDSVTYCNNKKQIRVKDFQRLYCATKASNVYIIVLGIVLSVVILSSVILIIICGYKHRAKRYINVATSPTKTPLDKASRHNIMIVPEGRTYKETELHVLVERAEPIIQTEYTGLSSDFITKQT